MWGLWDSGGLASRSRMSHKLFRVCHEECPFIKVLEDFLRKIVGSLVSRRRLDPTA